MNLIKFVPTIWMLFDGKTDSFYILCELRRFIGVKTVKVILQCSLGDKYCRFFKKSDIQNPVNNQQVQIQKPTKRSGSKS